MSRIRLTCGYWEIVDEVEPIVLYQTLGVTSMLCLYCYAMLVDVVWFLREFMKVVRVIVN